MNDESPIEEEYEPADIDPDDTVATVPVGNIGPPVEADPADWLDQHREIGDGLDDDER
jgi:hypothetical protein